MKPYDLWKETGVKDTITISMFGDYASEDENSCFTDITDEKAKSLKSTALSANLLLASHFISAIQIKLG